MMRHGYFRGTMMIHTLAAATVVGLGGLGASANAAPVNSDDAPVWVFFNDKGFASQVERDAAIADLANTYNQRAIQRRQLRRTRPGLFDALDLPLAPGYVQAVIDAGAERRIQSRWLNAISITASIDELRTIAAFPFVDHLEPVMRGRRRDPIASPDQPADELLGPQDDAWYGMAADQLNQINVIALHEAGYTGAGVIIGVLDTGFQRDHNAFNHGEHPLQVVAEYDFVMDDGNTGIENGDPGDQHAHGTMILGTLAAYAPNTYVGTAYDASFILCKTEDMRSETPIEEDFYVAGLEFIEANGGDVATSSLGYIDWYTQDDLDGQTAVTSIGVNIATGNGVYCCTAAGNSGHDSNANTSHLLAPADAFQVISCGAVNVYGEIASFSSDGPTADGRVKPEVLACGRSTYTIYPYDDHSYTTASGTSLSTPLVAGAVACIAQGDPSRSVDDMRTNLFDTGSYYLANGTFDPLYIHGYGIIDALAALGDVSAGFDFHSIIPGIAGETNSFLMSGATPDARVAIAYGFAAGSFEVPNCPGVFVDIANPQLGGLTVADANGDVTFDAFVPGAAQGRDIYFQAVEPDNCLVSNVMVYTFR